jgi:hypothetical protein
MEQSLSQRRNPELKQLVAEASRALAQLDAGRLEELALSCQALNRELTVASREDRVQFALQAGEAAGEMTVLARVLDGTRANLNVIRRLQDLRTGRLEYAQPPAAANCAWDPVECRHGDN